MARERKLPSTGSSSKSTDKKQANKATDAHNHAEKPITENDDKDCHTDATSPSSEATKHEQTFTTEPKDSRTFQQLVQDYGHDSECASPSGSLLHLLGRLECRC